MERARGMPWLTLLIAAMMAVLFLFTQRDDAMLHAMWYSRERLMHGEIWRLLTGHLVHFSAAHLAADLFAFAALATLVERQQGSRSLAMMLLWLALPASLAMLLLVPQLQYYGGISAINYGLMTWVCLKHPVISRHFMLAGWMIAPGKLVVGGVIAHIGFQYATAHSLLSAAPAGTTIVVAWQAHLACTLMALLLAIGSKYFAGVSLAVADR